ncbi:hypothetical protein C8R46DRAFT_1039712 [Mycena filopes]|nr:hypothetical protein C8R46DRAFT_1039712 [Mycena filopes]
MCARYQVCLLYVCWGNTPDERNYSGVCQNTRKQSHGLGSNTAVTVIGVVIGVAALFGIASLMMICAPRENVQATNVHTETAVNPGTATASSTSESPPAYSAPANGALLNQINMPNQIQTQIDIQTQAMTTSMAAPNPGMTSG